MRNKRTGKVIRICCVCFFAITVVFLLAFLYLRANSLDLLLKELQLSRMRDWDNQYMNVELLSETSVETSVGLGQDGNFHDYAQSLVLLTKPNPYCQLGSSLYSYAVIIRVERDDWGFWKLVDYNSLNMRSHCSFKWEKTMQKDGETVPQYCAAYVGSGFRNEKTLNDLSEVIEGYLSSDALVLSWFTRYNEYRIVISSPNQEDQEFDLMGLLEENGFVKYDDWPEPYEVPAELIVEDASKLTEAESNAILEKLELELSRITSMVPIDQDAVDAIFDAMARLGAIRITAEEVKATHPEAFWAIEGMGTQQVLMKGGMIFMVAFAVFLMAYPFVIGPLWDRYRTKKNEREREERNLRIREKE